jgi:hypothetical protein
VALLVLAIGGGQLTGVAGDAIPNFTSAGAEARGSVVKRLFAPVATDAVDRSGREITFFGDLFTASPDQPGGQAKFFLTLCEHSDAKEASMGLRLRVASISMNPPYETKLVGYDEADENEDILLGRLGAWTVEISIMPGTISATEFAQQAGLLLAAFKRNSTADQKLLEGLGHVMTVPPDNVIPQTAQTKPPATNP